MADEHTGHRQTPFGLKGHTVADLEFQHLSMGAFGSGSEALHDSMVEVDQFCFAEFVNVELYYRFPFSNVWLGVLVSPQKDQASEENLVASNLQNHYSFFP
jgi:hypothetical protein